MKHKFIIFIPLLLLALPNISHSEFYKYKDPQTGTIRYTDNLADVPPDQRKGLRAYETPEDFQPQTPPKPTDQAVSEKPAENPEKEPESQPLTNEEIQARNAKAKQLMEEKEALDAQYAEIQEARKALDAEKETVKRTSQLREYNQKAEALNQRIEAYEQKRQAYEKKVAEFNAAGSQ